MPLGKQIASRHLAVAAHLLPLGLQLLLAALTVHLKLLTVRHAVVDAVDAAIGHAGLTFDTLRPGLLTLHPRLALNALRPGLLTLHPRLTLGALRPRLATLRSLGELLALNARSALHPLLAALRPLDALVPAVTIDLRGLPILAATIVRPRIRRGRDRQRGDAGCEKNPGHKLSPSNGINGPFAAPFQRLNGWNLQVTALA